MTKQEKIDLEYRNIGAVNLHPRENGYASICNFGKSKFNRDLVNIITESCTDIFPNDTIREILIPKALVGIDNNNGWIKIESEDDLPITNGKIIQYFFVTKNGNITENGYSDLMKNKKIQYSKVYTHYQQIIKPREPLY